MPILHWGYNELLLQFITILICFRWIFIIANIEIKEKLFKGIKEYLMFGSDRISITGGSLRAGFNGISHMRGWKHALYRIDGK